MKISKFNTTLACNVPRKLSLRDPFTGELIKDDSGTIDFYIYGMLSDVARNADKDKTRQKAQGMDDEAIGAEFLARITQGWTPNLEDDSGPIAYSHDAAVALYLSQDWIARQVLQFAGTMGNFDPRRYEKQSDGSKKGRGLTAPQKAGDVADM